MVKNEMIERVARAIALAALDDDTRSVVNPETWPVAESYCDMARAAIEAMREPTEAMLKPEVVSRAENRLDEGNVLVNYIVPILDIWPQMIDAALSEKP